MQLSRSKTVTSIGLATVAVVLAAACGSSDRTTGAPEVDAGQSGGAAGSGGSAAAGQGGSGAVSAGGAGGSAGSAGTAGAGGGIVRCNPACPPETPVCVGGECVECAGASRRCQEDTPQECQGGSWVSLEPCPAEAPACTNGVCAVARVLGGLVTVQADLVAGELSLREHGFEYLNRTCAEAAGAMVCASGGLRP